MANLGNFQDSALTAHIVMFLVWEHEVACILGFILEVNLIHRLQSISEHKKNIVTSSKQDNLL